MTDKEQITNKDLKELYLNNINDFERICYILNFTDSQRKELKNNFQNIREIIISSFDNENKS